MPLNTMRNLRTMAILLILEDKQLARKAPPFFFIAIIEAASAQFISPMTESKLQPSMLELLVERTKRGISAYIHPQPACTHKQIFTIEGEIGAGKTELAKQLAATLERRGHSVCLVLEPVQQWKDVGILQEFYKDPTRFAYSFQTYVFATRVLAIHEAVMAKPEASIYIFERSPVTDPVFMALQEVAPLERAMYDTWCMSWLSMSAIDYSKATALYLRTSADVCMERVAKRAREGEIVSESTAKDESAPVAAGGVSAAYQALLRQANEAFFLGLHPGKFPNLPTNPIKSVIEVAPSQADGDFRASSPSSLRIINGVLRDMGYP